MNIETIKYPTLATELWNNQRKVHPTHPIVRAFALALIGSLLLTLSAKVQIPFYPVPLTMQTFVVLALGVVLGWKLGVITVLLYLAEGAIGLPVFAGTPEKGIGIAYLLGTSGGYLLGFVFAAAVCGRLAESGWDRRPSTTFAAMLIGNAIIYAFGLGWLGSVIGWDQPILALGMVPFLLGDLLKIGLAMLVLPKVWQIIQKTPKNPS